MNQITSTIDSRTIQPHSCPVSAPGGATATSPSNTAQAITQASTRLPHSRHSYRTRARPNRGGRHGGGPLAKRCANRRSAQRTMHGPNATLIPR